jgi:hypothetical protein
MSTSLNTSFQNARKVSSDSDTESSASKTTEQKKQYKKIALILSGVVFTIAYVELAPWLMNLIFGKKIKFSWRVYDVARKLN